MPFEVQKPIYSKLADRFRIKQGFQRLELADKLVPITNADSLLNITKGQTTSAAATSAFHDYTVPTGKKWYLRSIHTERANSGAIYFRISIGGTYYDFDGTSATTRYKPNVLGIEVKAGSIVRISFDTGTSGTLTSWIIYDEADINE